MLEASHTFFLPSTVFVQVEITPEYLRQKDPEAYSQLQAKWVLFILQKNYHCKEIDPLNLRYKDQIPQKLVYNKGL